MSAFTDPQETIRDLTCLLKAVVRQCGELYPPDDFRPLPEYSLFIPQGVLHNVDRAELSVMKIQDPWGMKLMILQRENEITEALRAGFKGTVPTPEQLRAGVKTVFGYDL